jgi:AcrR family transcriptional regulator
MAEPVKPRRRYRSERRRAAARETRLAILEAARRRFLERGYAGATIAAIAADAGTAAETVYATFGSKVALLEALVRGSARGEEDTEILEQAGAARVSAATDQREQLRLLAEDVTDRLERVGPLLVVLAAAAPGEPALAELNRRLHDARLRNLRTIPRTLARNGALRIDEEAAAETIWALASPDLYTLLTGARGWPRERYVTWLADALAAILLAAPSGGRRRR